MSDAFAQTAARSDPTGEFPRDLNTYLFHLFAVIGRHREARMEQILLPLGLNVARHRALSVIFSIAPCTMTQLADYSAVDRTTMTRTVDQLVEYGWVERATPREDRRQVMLSLTSSGAELCVAARDAIFRLGEVALAGLPEENQRAAARALETVLANLLQDDPALLKRLLLRRS